MSLSEIYEQDLNDILDEEEISNENEEENVISEKWDK